MRAASFLLLTLFLASCSSTGSYTDISAQELNSMISTEDVFLLDVHIPKQQHIIGTDSFIPYDRILENLDRIPDDKKIVVYCRSGSMSIEASEVLAAEGYEVYNLVGGANAWKSLGYEMEVG